MKKTFKHITLALGIISLINSCKKTSTVDFRDALVGTYFCAYHSYYTPNQQAQPGATLYDSILSYDTLTVIKSSMDSAMYILGQNCPYFSNANGQLAFGSPPPSVPALYFYSHDSMSYQNAFTYYAGGSYSGTYYLGIKIH